MRTSERLLAVSATQSECNVDLQDFTTTVVILSTPGTVKKIENILNHEWGPSDHLCGLVVRVPGYRSRGQGSIPSATRSEK
jgi:hypothetical protein